MGLPFALSGGLVGEGEDGVSGGIKARPTSAAMASWIRHTRGGGAVVPKSLPVDVQGPGAMWVSLTFPQVKKRQRCQGQGQG